MSDPMEQFKAIFFEECAELLISLEEGLMQLQAGDTDVETLHSVFRAVHSIKGGAGTFGFAQLVSFAHIQETLLDDMRAGALEMEPAYLDVLLKAFDVLTELVGAAQQGIVLDENYGAEVARAMTDILKHTGVPLSGEGDHAVAQAESGPGDVAAKEHLFQILFKPFPDMFQRANEPLLLIRELACLGRLETILDQTALPDLEDMMAEQAYFVWRFRLVTSANVADIEEIFEFVEGDCDLDITDLGPYLSPDAFVADDAAGLFEPEDTLVASSQKTTRPKDAKVRARSEEVVSKSIRVELDKVDRLVNMVGELVITQAMLQEQGGQILVEQYPNLVQGIDEMSRHVRELQDSVMAIRAQPVKSVFSRMPRLVRELTGALDKKARLVMSGEETEVDKTVTERIGDPLMHMIRNSVDHGLESPEERRAAGKDEEGVIHLSAFHRGGRIFIEIADDGAGINQDVVLRKAIERGLVHSDAILNDDEINNLIFMPGFSTAEAVTNVSGRGVGMDVVRKNIQSLGGRISIDSTPGKGSKFSMSLPLTLAVMDGMVVEIGREKYVLPLANIIQSLRPEPDEISALPDGRNLMMFRGDYISLVPLYDIFKVQDAQRDPCNGLVVVVEGEGGVLMGFIVDDLVNQQQVVIKSLEENYELVEGVSGATILGNGLVSLIVDIAAVQSLSSGPYELSETSPRPSESKTEVRYQ
ncbi:chemotaxis protein CheA [Paremcibacter congregatus]|uniref:chemotaxis protein CheA n=1 Tax=Paremcibacter congregatus TaxID=2043170 RepID=UPI0030EF8366|tara:strand:+ start:2488 stop:4590 length:2103 start_codon:yes stop_codon:yes gene_type:complete